MALTATDLRTIAARSSTMSERTTDRFAAVAEEPPALVGSRLDRLRDRVAGGDVVRFERYLCSHGAERIAIDRALGAVDCTDDDLPPWAAVLERLDTRDLERRTPAPAYGQAPDHAQEPFEEAWTPFLNVARAGAWTRAPACMRDASARGAWSALERGLLRQLARIAGRTLLAEFSAFRARMPHTRAGYDAFVGHLRAGGLDRVLIAYPVLARLLAMRVLDWIESSTEFLHRAATDGPQLAGTFALGHPLGSIVDIVTDLSDPHGGGRTVLRVSFASGLHLMYKPRSLALEAAFSSLLRWLNDGRVSLPLKAPVVLDGGTHGWMECVTAAPCADAAAAERYYRRAGMLLCLAFVLGGSDLHQGNVIASGEQPVLIDLEAFMNAPPQRSSTPDDAYEANRQHVWDSTLRTGLLPVSRLGLRGQPHRNGGLVEIDPRYGRRVPRWQRINSDRMVLAMGRPALHRLNVPHAGDAPMPVDDHVDAVIGGFAEMSGVLQRARADLLVPDGVLRPFRGVRTRIVLRDTGVYATLLDQALHPRRLRDGAEWSVEFALLAASTTATAESPSRSWTLSLAEQRALARLDIPLFTAASDETSIAADGRELAADYLAEPGYAATLTRIAELDAARTRVHLHSIRLALRAHAPRPLDRTDAGAGGAAPSSSNAPERFLPAAIAIGRTLRSIAEDGEASGHAPEWIGIRGLAGSTQRGLQIVGWDLCGGRCGLALFFAALESRGGWTDEPSFALRILGPLIDRLRARGRVDDDGIGALGVGGLVYALTTAAELLQSEALLDAAACAASGITVEAIDRDARLDVMWGAAGAALGLLALSQARPRAWIVDRAQRCGHRLLAEAVRDERGVRCAWRTVNGEIADGFAHGSAGIAHALAWLWRVTDVRAFRETATTALRSSCGERDGRADERSAGPAAAMRRSWCRGAAGVGLARLAVASLAACPHVREGLDGLLEDVAPASGGLSRLDHACCGNVGRFELLMRAAERLGEPRWRAAAATGAAQMIDRATARGSYAVSAVDDVFCPGFYNGLAGIGYHLLRLHDPGLPSVLSWSAPC